jgi:hypothetical protein
MANNYTWGFTAAAPQATIPTVNSHDPIGGATNVPINNSITATFSEQMDPMTITTDTFSISQGGAMVPGTVEFDGISTAVFIPINDLTMNTTYTAQITSDVTDAGGIHMANNVSWSFTTGMADTTVPSIVSSTPADGDKGVSVNVAIKITFSEAMDPTSVTFGLLQGANVVDCVNVWDSTLKVLTITPANPLAKNTLYNASINGGTDLAGIGAVSQTWSFTTSP